MSDIAASLRRELLIWKIAFICALVTIMCLGTYVLGDLLMASVRSQMYP